MNGKRFGGFCVAAMAALAVSAQIELVAPANGASVRQMHTVQREFAKAPWAKCEKCFDGAENSKKLRSRGSTPVPVKLQWKGDAKEYQVTLRRLPDGKVVFEQTVATNCVAVDSLEIATEWEWTVSAGSDKLVSTFKTEDCLPRLVRMTGTANCRDIGGRRGLDGRRIRQGLVYRTAGLNSNAPVEYYSKDEILELEKDGKLKKMGHTGRALHRKLKAGEELTSAIAKKSRLIKRKCFAPGKRRFTDDEVARILKVYGIRSDIDLRSDTECYGMTGSPLGPSVKWFHISYSAYSGAFTTNGMAITKAVFDVFMDDANYPLIFHCIGGADRTGSLAYVLNGFLGVAREDLERDWESTFYPDVPNVIEINPDKKFDHDTYWRSTTHFDKGFAQYARPGDTLQDRIVAYLAACGVTSAQMESVRANLLEPQSEK